MHGELDDSDGFTVFFLNFFSLNGCSQQSAGAILSSSLILQQPTLQISIVLRVTKFRTGWFLQPIKNRLGVLRPTTKFTAVCFQTQLWFSFPSVHEYVTRCSEHDVPDVGLVFKTKNKEPLNRKWCIVQFYFWRRWKRICVADCDGQNRRTVKENSVTHKGSAQNYVNTTCLFSSKDWLITHRYWTNAYYLNSVYLTCLITCQSNCLHWQLTSEWTTRMMA